MLQMTFFKKPELFQAAKNLIQSLWQGLLLCALKERKNNIVPEMVVKV